MWMELISPHGKWEWQPLNPHWPPAQILVQIQKHVYTQAISYEIIYYRSNTYQILDEIQEQTQAISYDSPRGGVSQITEKGETTASFLLIQVTFLWDFCPWKLLLKIVDDDDLLEF